MGQDESGCARPVGGEGKPNVLWWDYAPTGTLTPKNRPPAVHRRYQISMSV